MINRELIRLKLVQVLYSYLQKAGRNPDLGEKELLLSMDKAYDLYNYMLQLMVEVNRMALRTLEIRRQRSKRLGQNTVWSSKFVNNRFMLQLETNRQLKAYCEAHLLPWAEEEAFARNLYNKGEESKY